MKDLTQPLAELTDDVPSLSPVPADNRHKTPPGRQRGAYCSPCHIQARCSTAFRLLQQPFWLLYEAAAALLIGSR